MASSDDDVVTIRLEDTRDDVQMSFELEKSDNLRAVFDQYSAFRGISQDSLLFAYKGSAVGPDDSPTSLGIGDDDGNNIIRVSLTGEALTKETIVQSCVAGSISAAYDILSANEGLRRQPMNWFDSEGQESITPPIFIAIDYGHRDLVAKLLPLYSDMIDSVKGGDGDYSVLQWASWTGCLDIVKLLIEEGGAKVDEEALSLAREYDHDEVVELLLKHVDLYSGLEGDTDAIMERACREGDLSMVRKLLEEEGYDLEKWKDDDGKYLAFSPMHFAVRNGHLDVIQLFAEKGVQVDLMDAIPEESAE